MFNPDSRNSEFGLPPEEFPILREDDRPPLEERFSRAETIAPEYSAPGPEIVEPGTFPWQATDTAKKKIQQILYLTAALLVLLVGFGPWKGILHSADGTSDLPEPVVTTMPGDLELTIDYAILDGNTVEYLYSFDRHEVNYPVMIYAKIKDTAGNTAVPEYDPDVWDSSRSPFSYTMDVTGLSGDMTLEITAVFTRDSEEKSVTAVHSVTPKPPEVQTDASVVVTSADESGAAIDYEAHFIPDPADPTDYDLAITGFIIGWYSGDGSRQGYSRTV